MGIAVVTCGLLFVFFKDTATTEIYPLSLHDALPISRRRTPRTPRSKVPPPRPRKQGRTPNPDRKSGSAGMPRPKSYAVFCLKKQTSAQTGRTPAPPHSYQNQLLDPTPRTD